jgi:hypothetical protein
MHAFTYLRMCYNILTKVNRLTSNNESIACDSLYSVSYHSDGDLRIIKHGGNKGYQMRGGGD